MVTYLVDVLIQLQQDVAKQEYENAQSSYEKILLISIVALITGFLLSIGLGIKIIRQLTYQIGNDANYAASVVNEVVNGNLSVQINLRKNDKISLLYSINQMRVMLYNIIQDTNVVLENTLNGNLSSRIQTDMKGDFNYLKDNVNDSLDMIDLTLKDVISVANAFQNGDFSRQITTEYSGQFLEVKNAINQTASGFIQAIELEKVKEELLHQNRLNHLQKLESISRLTSGIAHDFNNILMCMLGYNEMNKMDSEDITNESLRASIENNTKQIDLAGKRAAELINKMLTYCRQNDDIKVTNIQATQWVIQEVLDMLRPALTNTIKVEFTNQFAVSREYCRTCDVLKTCSDQIQIDAMDLHQIVTNLAVNARDAMKERGGVITISLKKTTNSNTHCVACASIIEGDFIELCVADNGTGIDPKVLSRIFDPFFTTKPQGEGTGLGLSTISGMVHKANGHILVESVLGQGTSFRLLFPLAVLG